MPQTLQNYQQIWSAADESACELCLDGLPVVSACQECELAEHCDDCVSCEGDCLERNAAERESCCNEYAVCPSQVAVPCTVQNCDQLDLWRHTSPCQSSFCSFDHMTNHEPSLVYSAGSSRSACPCQNDCLDCFGNDSRSQAFCQDNACSLQQFSMTDVTPSDSPQKSTIHHTLASPSQHMTHPAPHLLLSPGGPFSSTLDGTDIGATSIDPFHCHWQDCDLSFLSSTQFDQHFLNDHFKTFQMPQEPLHQQLSCAWDQCHVAPESVPALFDHVKYDHVGLEQHHRCKWLVVDHDRNIAPCNMCFNTAEALTKHLTTDHVGSGQSEYICYWQDCNRFHRPFSQKQKIMRHIVIHTGDRPFVCDICNHTCSEESTLKQHRRTHTGEKPFSCSICQKTFSASTALSVHMRTHTGFKPLVCKHPGCGKRFSESSNLAKHMKTHLQARSLSCSQCAKTFQREDQLKRHIKTVHGVNLADSGCYDQVGR